MNPRPAVEQLKPSQEDSALITAILQGDSKAATAIKEQSLIYSQPFSYLPTNEFALLYAPWEITREIPIYNKDVVPLYRLLGKKWQKLECTLPALAILNNDPRVLAHLLAYSNNRFQINSRTLASYPTLVTVWHGHDARQLDPEFTTQLAKVIGYLASHTEERDYHDHESAISRILFPDTDAWATWEIQPLHIDPLLVPHYPVLAKYTTNWIDTVVHTVAQHKQNGVGHAQRIEGEVTQWLRNLAKAYIQYKATTNAKTPQQ